MPCGIYAVTSSRLLCSARFVRPYMFLTFELPIYSAVSLKRKVFVT